MNKYKKPKIPPGINPKKVLSEAQSRQNILDDAKGYGCHEKVVKCFARYDEMLAKSTSDLQRQQIAIMGSAELYRIMGLNVGLSVDGVEVIPNSEEPKKEE